jgi:hypothetical protein
MKTHQILTVCSAELLHFEVPCYANGSGNPNVWSVVITATFACRDINGELIGGSFQSGDDKIIKIPYFILLENIPNDQKPTSRQISDAFFASKDKWDDWVQQQITNLAG